MKIVKVLGGLGNQMFQYALYIALKENFPKEQVYIDISSYNGYALHNGFELKTVFSISLNQAPRKAIASAGYYLPHYRLWQVGKLLRSEEHTSELQSRQYLVCRLLLEKKK